MEEEFSLSSVAIGDTFYCNRKEYRVTDKGTRVIVAIHVSDQVRRNPSWLQGPPYALVETVFDEDDFPAMSLQPNA